MCIWIVDYLQDRCKGSTLYGFRGGPAGIMKGKYVVLTPEYIYPYRNQVPSTSRLTPSCVYTSFDLSKLVSIYVPCRTIFQ